MIEGVGNDKARPLSSRCRKCLGMFAPLPLEHSLRPQGATGFQARCPPGGDE
jgi:hypothetical protein